MPMYTQSSPPGSDTGRSSRSCHRPTAPKGQAPICVTPEHAANVSRFNSVNTYGRITRKQSGGRFQFLRDSPLFLFSRAGCRVRHRFLLHLKMHARPSSLADHPTTQKNRPGSPLAFTNLTSVGLPVLVLVYGCSAGGDSSGSRVRALSVIQISLGRKRADHYTKARRSMYFVCRFARFQQPNKLCMLTALRSRTGSIRLYSLFFYTTTSNNSYNN